MKSDLGSLERKFYWFLRHPEAPPHWETCIQELTCEHSDRAKVPWPTGETSTPDNVLGKGRLPGGYMQKSHGPPSWQFPTELAPKAFALPPFFLTL